MRLPPPQVTFIRAVEGPDSITALWSLADTENGLRPDINNPQYGGRFTIRRTQRASLGEYAKEKWRNKAIFTSTNFLCKTPKNNEFIVVSENDVSHVNSELSNRLKIDPKRARRNTKRTLQRR
eukprot:TRINITY_DN5843_c0_g1_i1.p1 TRINITY_DN5843_c0_g1~~TRINITY_DN5843_c0_g1_i1.p1  ORF type:complete len:123 (+),score=8.22 TRINITY_DN5843_c0_g1_i1:212-580(+)